MQKRILETIVILWVAQFLSGCAYFTKSKCEKTNWFERGETLALDGKYPQNDPFLKECRKVEADINEGQLDSGWKRGRDLYCSPERAFDTGKTGKLFAPDICSSSNTKHLLAAHAKGVRAYCTPETGKLLGASGEKFNSICPDDLEVPFKQAYNKARKSHLEGLLPGLQQELVQKQMQLGQAQSQLSFAKGQQAVLNGQLAQSKAASIVSPQTASLQAQFDQSTAEVDQNQNNVSRLNGDINRLMSQISSVQAEIQGLKD